MYLLKIYDLYNIERKYLVLLNDKILLNYPFVKYLNVSHNPKITNVNHMHNLIKLNASYFSEISDYSIRDLNLITLYTDDNYKITNVNHMNKLTVLYARGDSGINDNGSLVCFSKLSNPH
jgi:hypothetical protein